LHFSRSLENKIGETEAIIGFHSENTRNRVNGLPVYRRLEKRRNSTTKERSTGSLEFSKV
jgi:hypothetical protein